MDACNNVKNQLVGKTIRACGSFMILQARCSRHEIVVGGAIIAQNELQYGFFAVKIAEFETTEICFDLYISGESNACNTVVQYSTCSPWFTFHNIPFLQFQHQRESQLGVATVETQRFSLMPWCVLHRLETRICRNSGLPGWAAASFFRFPGVFLFGAETEECTPLWRSP